MGCKNVKKPKALIVDDEAENRIFLALLLQLEGWEVSQARDGKEAIAQVLNCPPNLLILDHRMPELTGVDVYQYLQLQGIKLPVILISADIEIDNIASSAGIIYYLQKPFNVADFIQTVNSAYENFM